jgi:iron complex outermembrane receptor protein
MSVKSSHVASAAGLSAEKSFRAAGTSRKSALALAVGVALGTGAGLHAPQTDAAEGAAADSQILEQVLVTARKREETLTDVSAAISVVGADELRASGINDVRDLQKLSPELNVGEVVGLMKVTMRGLGNTSNTRGEDTEVTFYVDGAVVARQEAQSMAMFDLARIEVLRGPQGTLYGRNSTGGTLNLITAKPTEEFTGYVDVSAGNYNFRKIDTALSGPISDNVLGRIAVQSISRDGFGTNITTGNEIDDDSRYAARGQLQFNFSDSAQLLLSGEYGKENDSSGLFTYFTPLYVVGPPAPATQAPKGIGGFSDPNSRNGAGNIDPELKRESRSITGTFTWDITPNLTFKNIANWRDLDFYVAQDLDLSSVVPPPGTTATVAVPLKDRHMSDEAQLTYATDRLTLIGGLYWFTEKLSGTTFVGDTPTQNVYFYRAGYSDGDSYAAFFNVNYQAFDWLTARVGGRYSRDERRIDNWQWVAGNLIVPPNSPTNVANDERADSKYIGEYGLDFHLTEQAMIYYTFSQGYRQGAAVIMQTNNPIIGPTTVRNNEVGIKFENAVGTFAVDLAAYDMKIEDLQRTQAVPTTAGGPFNTLINNINGMDVKGVELSSRWAPIPQFSMSGGVAYTDAEFSDYLTDDPLQFGNLLVQLQGNTPQLSPEWKGNLGAQYTFALGGSSELTVGGNASYVGKQFFDEFNREPFVGDSYTLYDGNVTYRPISQAWSVSLWGRNLGNDKEFADLSYSALGRVTSKKFINPRTYGVSFNYNF